VLYFIANVTAIILYSTLVFFGGVYVTQFMISPPEMAIRFYTPLDKFIQYNYEKQTNTVNAELNQCNNERNKLLMEKDFLNRQLIDLQEGYYTKELLQQSPDYIIK
jgi:hypothetical protein